jgi:hypothetical protein
MKRGASIYLDAHSLPVQSNGKVPTSASSPTIGSMHSPATQRTVCGSKESRSSCRPTSPTPSRVVLHEIATNAASTGLYRRPPAGVPSLGSSCCNLACASTGMEGHALDPRNDPIQHCSHRLSSEVDIVFGGGCCRGREPRGCDRRDNRESITHGTDGPSDASPKSTHGDLGPLRPRYAISSPTRDSSTADPGTRRRSLHRSSHTPVCSILESKPAFSPERKRAAD